jgi:hypothetical protein
MFDYDNISFVKKNLKHLRDKIYIKQKFLLQYMYLNNINFKDPNIKIYIDEINLLNEIYSIKKHNFDYDFKINQNKSK